MNSRTPTREYGLTAGKPPLAASIATVMIVLTCVLVWPSATLPLGEVKPFFPIFITAVVITEYLTAYMLLVHFRATGDAFFAALAGASLFVAVMAGVQLLIFPGAFAPNGLFNAGPQSSAWIWVLWHGGYPLLVLQALFLRIDRLTLDRKIVHLRIGASMTLFALVSAVALAFLAVVDGERLPPLINGFSYAQLLDTPIAQILAALNVLAFAACLYITRLKDRLSVWLAVAIVASLADVLLTLAGGARFTLGWYAARGLSVVSSSVVLGGLMWQTSVLYRQLAQAHEELAERAVFDALTGVRNRGHFIDQFPRDVRQAQREREPLAVLMIDIDHFKAYNDMYGHQRGDECLRAIARAMQGALKRPADYLARYGGEEFVAVLPNTSPAGALYVAKSMRDAVAALALPGALSAHSIVTVSMGLAEFNPEWGPLDSGVLIRRADDALYRAKREGRDRIVIFDAKRPDLITELRDP